jgi:hypothetical protein
MSKLSQITIALIIYLIIFTLFFSQIFFRNQVFYCCDNTLINIPEKILSASYIIQGKLPLWNPNILSGTPLLADINTNSLYPTTILFAYLSPYLALTISILIHIFLAGLGMIILTQLFSVSIFPSIAAGILYSLSGTYITYTGNLPMAQTAAYLPWIMIAAVKYIKSRKLQWFVILSFALGLQILAGSPQLAYYSWLLLISYFLVFLPDNLIHKIRLSIALAISVIGLAAIQLLPFTEFVLNSTRLGRGWSYATFGSLNPFWLIRLILPTITGSVQAGTAWITGGSIYGYIGVMPLFLIIFAVWTRKEIRFFGIIAAVFLLLSFGNFSPVYALAYYILPGVSLFRVPTHFLLITTFSLCILAAIIVEEISLGKSILRKNIRLFICLFLALLLLGTGIYFYRNQISNAILHELFLFGQKGLIKFGYLGRNGVESIISSVSLNIIWIGLSLSVFFWFSLKRSNFVRYAFFVIIIIDLFLFIKPNLQIENKNSVMGWEEKAVPLVTAIKSAQKQNPGRLYVDPVIYQAPRIKAYGLSNEFAETVWQFYILRPNLAGLWNIPTIDGYASMIYGKYQKYYSQSSADPTGITLGNLDRRELDEAGLRYVLTKAGDKKFQSTGKYSEIFEQNGLVILENQAGKPLIELKSTDMGNGIFQQFNSSPDIINGNVTNSDKSSLIIRNVNYPGWIANVDRKEVKIEPYTDIFMSVPIPAGSHAVNIFYQPISVKIGVFISILTAIILIILFIGNFNAWLGSKPIKAD